MASKSLNKVQLIGNVTRDPELRYTPQGNAVCQVGLATNRSWKTENGEMREEAEFHRLVAWNKLAELCSQLLTKGRKIYVEGRLQTRTFTGSDNAQHTITEIVIDDMILLDSKMAQGGGQYQGNQGGFGQARGNAPVAQQNAATAQNAVPQQNAAPADDSSVVPAEQEAEAAPAAAAPAKGKKKATTEEKGEESAEKPVREDVDIDDIPF